MKDKRHRMALTWPYANPHLAVYMFAAAATAASYGQPAAMYWNRAAAAAAAAAAAPQSTPQSPYNSHHDEHQPPNSANHHHEQTSDVDQTNGKVQNASQPGYHPLMIGAPASGETLSPFMMMTNGMGATCPMIGNSSATVVTTTKSPTNTMVANMDQITRHNGVCCASPSLPMACLDVCSSSIHSPTTTTSSSSSLSSSPSTMAIAHSPPMTKFKQEQMMHNNGNMMMPTTLEMNQKSKLFQPYKNDLDK